MRYLSNSGHICPWGIVASAVASVLCIRCIHTNLVVGPFPAEIGTVSRRGELITGKGSWCSKSRMLATVIVDFENECTVGMTELPVKLYRGKAM